jgi:hypothetical protein
VRNVLDHFGGDGLSRSELGGPRRPSDAIVDAKVTVFSPDYLQRRHPVERLAMLRDLSRQLSGIGP